MNITRQQYLQNPCGASSLPYFRLYHDLQGLRAAVLPEGFRLCEAATADYAAHINQCYGDGSITEAEISAYAQHPVYSAELWDAVQALESKEIVATGVAELDEDVGEGILEWIQVSPAYRGHGLESYVVTELLTRMSKKARFATVSGQVNNPSNPEGLYRKCGFQGNDVWHIMRIPIRKLNGDGR